MSDPKRVAAGKLSKNKGKSFERYIVTQFTEAGVRAKRGWWQSGEFAKYRGGTKPRIPDVIVDGFWLELGTGATMDEYKKLDQAFLDIADQETIPVAITRRKGCRTVYATLLLGDLVIMAGGNRKQCGAPGLRVSIHLDEFIAMVKKLQDQRDARGRRPTTRATSYDLLGQHRRRLVMPRSETCPHCKAVFEVPNFVEWAGNPRTSFALHVKRCAKASDKDRQHYLKTHRWPRNRTKSWRAVDLPE